MSELRPADVPDAGTVQLTDALQKYEHRPPSQFYDASISEAWVGADLMLKGIGMAGASPTSAGVIRSLRSITSYNGDGLDAESTDYAVNFGHDPAKTCLWFLKAEKTAGLSLCRRSRGAERTYRVPRPPGSGRTERSSRTANSER